VLSRVLARSAEQQLNDTRGLVSDLREALTRAPATDQDARTFGTVITQLDDFFLLVVVGEVNADKSAFINALVGASISSSTFSMPVIRSSKPRARSSR
jgi:hypothetical protein